MAETSIPGWYAVISSAIRRFRPAMNPNPRAWFTVDWSFVLTGQVIELPMV